MAIGRHVPDPADQRAATSRERRGIRDHKDEVEVRVLSWGAAFRLAYRSTAATGRRSDMPGHRQGHRFGVHRFAVSALVRNDEVTHGQAGLRKSGKIRRLLHRRPWTGRASSSSILPSTSEGEPTETSRFAFDENRSRITAPAGSRLGGAATSSTTKSWATALRRGTAPDVTSQPRRRPATATSPPRGVNLQARVREKPADAALRVFLFQLLCVLGQWQRASTSSRSAANSTRRPCRWSTPTAKYSVRGGARSRVRRQDDADALRPAAGLAGAARPGPASRRQRRARRCLHSCARAPWRPRPPAPERSTAFLRVDRRRRFAPRSGPRSGHQRRAITGSLSRRWRS